MLHCTENDVAIHFVISVHSDHHLSMGSAKLLGVKLHWCILYEKKAHRLGLQFSKARKASSVLSPAPFVNQLGKTR